MNSENGKSIDNCKYSRCIVYPLPPGPSRTLDISDCGFNEITVGTAFKVNGKRVELCRTTQDKTHKDFIKCTKLPLNSEICFLDDAIHSEMINDNIYYINLKPYYYDLQINTMISKFKNSIIGKKIIINEEVFEEIMKNEFKKYNYTCLDKNLNEYEVDKVLGKQIMVHLHEFFNKSVKNKTRKFLIKKNKTKRKY